MTVARPGDTLAYGWALRRADGDVVFDAAAGDEARIWQIGLGWPSPEEIAAQVGDGARAYRCKLVVVSAEPAYRPECDR